MTSGGWPVRVRVRVRFWDKVVEHLVRVEFQGRGTLHFHIAFWALVKGDLRDFVHSPKRNRRSELGLYLHELLECDVDIRVGSGFLNYINGYVVKASDCIDFSANEHSEEDKDGANHTDWKRA